MEVIKILTILIFALINVQTLPLQNVENATVNPIIAPKINYRLPNTTIPIHYNVKLIPHIESNFSVIGASSTIFKVQESTLEVAFHTKYLKINKNSTTLKYENGTVVQPLQFNHNAETDILILYFKNALMPGIYTLDMEFVGFLGNTLTGFYRSSYLNEKGEKVWMAVTHFQPSSARTAFPCWDEPALKATFNISIKHYNNYTALSNMLIRIVSDVDETDGKVWTHFEQTPIMSTNILAFVVADYDRISNKDGTINIWCKKHALKNVKYFLEYAVKSKQFLEEYLNSTVRVPKIDYVAVPTYATAATENWGLITYWESLLVHNETEMLLSRKQAAILTGIHELVHMWFGNLVSPAWWRYVWLSEGFATYLKYYITDKMFKAWRLLDQFPVYSIRLIGLTSDSQSAWPLNEDVESIPDISRKFSYTAYHKAPALLHMLMHVIGEDVFRDGIIKYLDKHQYKAVTPDDLWEAFQDALDESGTNHNGIDVKEVMDPWIKQGGYPLVTVTRDYVTGETKVTQKWYKNYLEDNSQENNQTWWIPLNFATQSNPDFSSTSSKNWFKPRDQEMSIQGVDVNDWIIINIQQIGFYRVNYDETNWRKIAKYLNSDNFDKIHLLNRVQLLDDAFTLASTKRLSYDIVFELLNYLERETDYMAWHLVFHTLRMQKELFSVPKLMNTVQPFALKLMNNLVESVNFEDQPGDNYPDYFKRFAVMEWACFFGHAGCQENATIQLAKHLDDPDSNKILPDKKEWIFCSGLRRANQSIWNKVFDMYKKNPSKNILLNLACSENSVVIENFLERIFMDDSPILNEHVLDTVLQLYQNNRISQNITENFIFDNLERINSTIKDMDGLFLRMIYRVHTLDQFEKISQYITERSNIKSILIYQRESYIQYLEKKVTKVINCFKDQTRDVTGNSLSEETPTIDNGAM